MDDKWESPVGRGAQPDMHDDVFRRLVMSGGAQDVRGGNADQPGSALEDLANGCPLQTSAAAPHGGPALSTFPRRPFAVLVSQRFGWRDVDLEVDDVKAGGEEHVLAWKSLRELCGDSPAHELARLVARVSAQSAGQAVELDSLHAQLCSGGESSRHRLSVGPHVRLTWEPSAP